MANYGSAPPPTQTNGNDSVKRTRILLLGLRRSGKTSIQQVLFNDLSPKQTFYLEPTMRVVKHAYDTLIPLEIWDCPGNITVDTLGAPLSQFSSLIFVIDIRDLYNQPISKLVEFIDASCRQNLNINIEVFVHKAEKLQEDDKIENFRQIHERVSDRLLDMAADSPDGPNYEQAQLNFHLTSVYDHSIHEAFSRVLHKLMDSLPYLEDLLNGFCANSQSPKAFLFDITSRLYIATDASPVDSATHNLCCDYLGIINAFGPLYRSKEASPPRRKRIPPSSMYSSVPSPSTSQPQTPPPTAVTPTATHSPAEPSSRRPSSSNPALSAGQPFSKHSGSTLLRPALTPMTTSSGNTAISSSASSTRQNSFDSPPPKDLFYPSASTTLSPTPTASTNHSSKHAKTAMLSNHGSGTSTPNGQRSSNQVASLNNSSSNAEYTYPNATTLTYHALTPHLALLALLPSAVYEGRRGLVEWNVVWVREGVREIWEVEWEGRGG